MTFAAVAIGGAALIGGVSSYLGSQAQAGAAKNAAQLQQQQFEETRQDQAPWRAAGTAAIGQQSNLLGLNGQPAQQNAFANFRADPGYQYTVDQSTQAIDRSAAARGLLTSGATIKAIQDRASNLADQSYGNYFARLAGVSGTGQTATNETGQAGATAATKEGNALITGGNAQASGYAGIAQSANQGAEGYLTNNYFNQLTRNGGGSPSYSGGYAVPSTAANGFGEFYGVGGV